MFNYGAGWGAYVTNGSIIAPEESDRKQTGSLANPLKHISFFFCGAAFSEHHQGRFTRNRFLYKFTIKVNEVLQLNPFLHIFKSYLELRFVIIMLLETYLLRDADHDFLYMSFKYLSNMYDVINCELLKSVNASFL